jgi:hypothetical protein
MFGLLLNIMEIPVSEAILCHFKLIRRLCIWEVDVKAIFGSCG